MSEQNVPPRFTQAFCSASRSRSVLCLSVSFRKAACADVCYPRLLSCGSLGGDAFRQRGLRLAEVHDVLGSFLLLSGWLCPFKINFTKKYSIPTCERNLCFTESKGFWWQFWATIENSGETIIHVMSFISCSIDSHSAALPVWPLSTCSKSSQSWYLAIYYYIKPL